MTWYHKTWCSWPNRACGARPNRDFRTGLIFTKASEGSPVRPCNNKLCWARVKKPSHVCNATWMPATLKSVLKPKLLSALYQTKPQNAGIVLTPASWLATNSETLDWTLALISEMALIHCGFLITLLPELGKTMPALRWLGFPPLVFQQKINALREKV